MLNQSELGIVIHWFGNLCSVIWLLYLPQSVEKIPWESGSACQDSQVLFQCYQYVI